jgi:hypothetical protein
LSPTKKAGHKIGYGKETTKEQPRLEADFNEESRFSNSLLTLDFPYPKKWFMTNLY